VSWRAFALFLLAACDTETFSDPRAVAVFTATPRDTEVIYSSNEDLSAIVFDTFQTLPPELGWLEVEVDGTYQPLGGAHIESDVATVVSGAILPGRLAAPRMRFHLQAPERTIVVSAPANFREDAFSFTAAFTDQDAAVTVAIHDPFASFASGRLMRSFQVSLRDASCAQSLVAAEGTVLEHTLVPPLPLSADGHYCVRVDNIDKAIVTRPILIEKETVFTPPALTAPSVVVPIYDFELTDPDRCHMLMAQLDAAIAKNAPTVTSAIVLSGQDCRHTDATGIDPNALHARVQGLIDVPTPPVVLLFMITNVEQPPAAELPESLFAAQAWAGTYGARLDAALLGTTAVYMTFPFVEAQGWTFAADPDLDKNLAAVLHAVLPYQRYEHPPDMVVPFFPDGVGADWFGFKLCHAKPEVKATVAFSPFADFADPAPGYRFDLVTDWQPQLAFETVRVVTALEICTGYCTLPQAAAWRTSSNCESDSP
jgi:hypothetical protein